MSELTNYALSHTQFLYVLLGGFVGGFALGHLDDMVAYFFHALMMVPLVRAWVVANPLKAKQIVDKIAADLDQDIDKQSSAPQEPPKPA